MILGRTKALPQWRVAVGFCGQIAFVKACSAKVFAEAEAKRLRLQYPDRRAEFWATNACFRPTARWVVIEPRLDRDGDAVSIFGASTREAADRRVMSCVRSAIRAALAERRREPRFAALPYTVGELMAHIQVQFQPGMSWANYGEWVIDHIKPRAAFDMREPDQLAQCWSLDNLQPLWFSENSAKGTSDKALVAA